MHLKYFLSLVLLLAVPSTILYPVQPYQKAYVPDCYSSYDEILQLLDDIESGRAEEKYTEDDLEEICVFLANLARQGLLPGEDRVALEKDIQELLFFDNDDTVTNCAHVILCKKKGWFHKRWDHVKNFCGEHKKALIIAGAVVVGVAVVVAVVAAAPAAVAAAAAAIPAPEKPTNSPPPPVAMAEPLFNAAMEKEISAFKENLTQGEFFKSCSTPECFWGENGRVLGAIFAQQSLAHMNDQFFAPVGASNSAPFNFVHPEIDQKFGIHSVHLFENPSNTNFDLLAYQMRGERALGTGFFDQAVSDLGKVITLDPVNPIPYLQRGVAHFGLGQYDQSLNDYQQFASQIQRSHPFSLPGFSLGFAKGLPQGIYDSGEGLFLFLTDLVTHPIHTGEQMWGALTTLSTLAHSQEWEALSQAIAPEVHQLVKEWDTLPSERRGELAGYALGKYGSDIILPSALAKVAAEGLKGAQELSSIYKSLQTAEQTLLLESVSRLENGAKIGEVVQASQATALLAEDLGFNIHEMIHLKQAGKLEEVVANAFENVSKNAVMHESFELFDRAQNFLKPHKGFMTEVQCRDLIHQTGIRTFPKPNGIPENFLVRITDRGAGIEYVHPANPHIRIRIMPGKPHSPFSYQQKPYVVHMKDGKAFDKLGNMIDKSTPEAHISLEEFIYRNN